MAHYDLKTKEVSKKLNTVTAENLKDEAFR